MRALLAISALATILLGSGCTTTSTSIPLTPVETGPAVTPAVAPGPARPATLVAQGPFITSTGLSFPAVVGLLRRGDPRGAPPRATSNRSTTIVYNGPGEALAYVGMLEKWDKYAEGADNSSSRASFASSVSTDYTILRRKGVSIQRGYDTPPKLCDFGGVSWLCATADVVGTEPLSVHLLQRGVRGQMISIQILAPTRDANIETYARELATTVSSQLTEAEKRIP